MTEESLRRRCAWCGAVVVQTPGPGRPRRYCRRSHRQRAFEARRLGERMGLDRGEALVDAGELAALRDRLWELGAALDDVERDLRGRPPLEEYRRAFQHLYAAAAQLRDAAPEPIAQAGAGDPG